MTTKYAIVLLSALALTACGSGSSDSSGKTKSPSQSNDTNKAQHLYDVVPNIEQCQAGQLSEFAKQEALNTLNDIRKLHNLPPVSYDYSSDKEVMQASLIMTAKQGLTHTPSQTDKCFTQEGNTGAQRSNLGLGYGSPSDNIIGWTTDRYSSSIGHRRWQLNPFLTKIAYGVVQSPNGGSAGAALKVIHNEDKATSASLGVIAYPYQNYPSKYFDKEVPLSFSILANQSSIGKNRDIDFSTATITVKERQSGQTQALTNIKFDNQSYGLPNSYEFKMPSLKYGTIYDVSIINVKVNNTLRDYDYWFKITP